MQHGHYDQGARYPGYDGDSGPWLSALRNVRGSKVTIALRMPCNVRRDQLSIVDVNVEGIDWISLSRAAAAVWLISRESNTQNRNHFKARGRLAIPPQQKVVATVAGLRLAPRFRS